MTRRESIDRIRGLAILLMVVDHVLAVSDSGLWCRFTITRASLPLFALVSGYLLANRNPSPRRVVQVFVCGVWCSLLVPLLPGFPMFDVLLPIGVALLCWPVARHWPIIALVVGAVQGYTFAALGVGYQPGHVLALMLAGLLLRQTSSPADLQAARRVARLLPSSLGSIGRRPLAAYVVHLSVLACSVALWSCLGGSLPFLASGDVCVGRFCNVLEGGAGACRSSPTMETILPIMPETFHLTTCPPDGQKLWRYMSLPKYLSSLEWVMGPAAVRPVLPFSSINHLRTIEPNEGAFSGEELVLLLAYRLDSEAKKIQSLRENKDASVDDLLVSDEQRALDAAEPEFLQIQYECDKWDRALYCSCWHINTVESRAMWAMYCRDSPESIAIRTTVGALRDALWATDHDFLLGNVRYDDIGTQIAKMFREQGLTRDLHLLRSFRKLPAHKHENEFRVVFDSPSMGERRDSVCPDVWLMPFHYSKLKYEIRVHPDADQWVFDLIKRANAQCGVQVDCVASELSRKPWRPDQIVPVVRGLPVSFARRATVYRVHS